MYIMTDSFKWKNVRVLHIYCSLLSIFRTYSQNIRMRRRGRTLNGPRAAYDVDHARLEYDDAGDTERHGFPDILQEFYEYLEIAVWCVVTNKYLLNVYLYSIHDDDDDD